ARLIDHHRGAARRVQIDEFVAPLPRRFAHQFVTHALFAQQKADLARKGTERELIELPHASGIAAAGRHAQRLWHIDLAATEYTKAVCPELVEALFFLLRKRKNGPLRLTCQSLRTAFDKL